MWRFYLLAFLSGACTMTLELVAGRLIAPDLGVSLYTWTSVIGVVLAGISAGSFVGGWMADRWQPRRLLSYTLILAGLATASIITTLPLVMNFNWPAFGLALLKVVLPVAFLFGIPSFIIGLVSPIIYRICLTDLQHTGSTVGRLAASGSLGSIAGTFATGFWLIPAIGTRTIVYGVAAVLTILGILYMPRRTKLETGISTLLALAVFIYSMGPLETVLRPPGQEESAYFTIRVEESYDQQWGTVKKLILDSLIHSGASPEHPEYLWYEYEKITAWLIEQDLGETPRAFFIGGGGYTLPYWLEYFKPRASIEVAEIDPAVTRVALREFINPNTRIVTHNMDARIAFKNLPKDKKYDFIYGDAFNDLSVPYHLTTREFATTVRDRLAPQGIYVANVVDKPDGPFLGAFARTLTGVFSNVYVLPGSSAVLDGNRGPNLIVASMSALPWEKWYPQAQNLPFPVEARQPAPGQLLLTDDHAPVDNLLLPVFADRLRG